MQRTQSLVEKGFVGAKGAREPLLQGFNNNRVISDGLLVALVLSFVDLGNDFRAHRLGYKLFSFIVSV
ncbi:hypothetical protein D3C84_1066880 [compost metagenome]